MSILDTKEFRDGIMKSSVNMEHPFDMVIKASATLMVLMSVYPGQLHIKELGVITGIR